jgi:hypothetical protein
LLSVANSEFKQSRVGRLITIHGKVRDVVKINLKTLEKVVMINEEAKKFSTTTIIKDNRMVEEYGVDEIDDIIANTSNSEKVAQTKDITADMQEKYKGKPSEGHLMLEIFARNKQIQQLLTSMMNIAQQKEENNIQLNDVKDRLAEIREVTLDQTVMLGQVDIAITDARELSLERFLNPEFKKILNQQNRKSSSSRYEANKVLNDDIDAIIAKRTKESKVTDIFHHIFSK